MGRSSHIHQSHSDHSGGVSDSDDMSIKLFRGRTCYIGGG